MEQKINPRALLLLSGARFIRFRRVPERLSIWATLLAEMVDSGAPESALLLTNRNSAH